MAWIVVRLAVGLALFVLLAVPVLLVGLLFLLVIAVFVGSFLALLG